MSWYNVLAYLESQEKGDLWSHFKALIIFAGGGRAQSKLHAFTKTPARILAQKLNNKFWKLSAINLLE